MGPQERILVIKLGAFGDLVQADGAMRDIRAFHPDAEITLLTMPPFRKLMSRCPHVDNVVADTRGADEVGEHRRHEQLYWREVGKRAHKHGLLSTTNHFVVATK
jgi:ADP-heptose:LPS heptosyltransferase